MVVIGMLAAVTGLMLLGSEPEIDLTVDELMESPETYEGESFRIHGAIIEGSINYTSGTLIIEGENASVTIDHSAIALPVGATDGKTISVRGEFKKIGDDWIMDAFEIKTGCPSKYEPESD
jgi:cytochrome c-type biogenesis protein CcmE